MIEQNRLRPPLNIKRIIAFVSMIVFTGVIVAGLMQRSLTLTVYEISSAALPAEFDGYKIAHISDYHSGLFSGSAENVIAMTAKQSPDIICLTGDIVDGRTQGYSSVEALVAGLSEIAPVYAVFGNNELYDASIGIKLDEIYDRYGVQRIDGKKITIYNGDGTLTLLGIADPGGDDMTLDRDVLSLKENYNTGDFGIILYHRANEFGKLTGMGYHLVLSGHLHGGLIRIPGIGGVLSPYNVLFPEYSGGLYEENGVYLVSNCGIGNNHPIPRVYNPPEVVIIILHTGE